MFKCHWDTWQCFVRLVGAPRASLAVTLLLCGFWPPGAGFAQNRLLEQPASPQLRADALHLAASAGHAPSLSQPTFEEWLEAADIVAFGRILAPARESEQSRSLEKVHAFRLIRTFKGENAPEAATVFEPTADHEVPFLVEGEHYVLLLRRRSALAEYDIMGDSTVNLHIDHRSRTPAGDNLRALDDRIRDALNLPPLDDVEDEAAEAVLPAGIPLVVAAPDNDPTKAAWTSVGGSKAGAEPKSATQVLLYEDFEGVFPGASSVLARIEPLLLA